MSKFFKALEKVEQEREPVVATSAPAAEPPVEPVIEPRRETPRPEPRRKTWSTIGRNDVD